jgi:hypothetical protein
MSNTRKSNRLTDKSLYAGNNLYFVTICTQDRICLFDTVGAGFIRPGIDELQIDDKNNEAINITTSVITPNSETCQTSLIF